MSFGRAIRYGCTFCSITRDHASVSSTTRLTPSPGTWIVDNIGLTEVQVGFDEPVSLPLPQDAVTAWTVGGGILTGFTTSCDEGTDMLSIIFDSAIRDDRVTVVIDYSITDLAGNELDGEIVDPANAVLPSGDGVRGGQTVFGINVLQGDVNRDGVVDATDGGIIAVSLGLCEGDQGFDLNGDGCVNVLDVGIFTTNEGQELPTVDGVPPNVVAIDSPDSTTVVLSFNESIAPKRFSARSCFLVDDAGALAVPASAILAPNGLSATYIFDQSMVPCIAHTVNVSNALADASGMLLERPMSLPTIGTVPPAPQLDAHVTMTNTRSVVVSGTAQPGSSVEVSGPNGIFTVSARRGTFSADVPLTENHVNHVFFTAINSDCDDERSAPTPTAITHDAQPPSLFIDFPPSEAELTTEVIDVAGRVGDVLGGYLGLTVSVNGIDAIVNVGIGTNGTFVAGDVPLNLGENTLIVTAIDALGNTVDESITVTRVGIPVGAPQMSIFSGNGQDGSI